MMNLMNGMRKTKMMKKINLNIGLQEIKWIKLLKVHDYLDSLPEIGKVLSFGSILRVAEDLNNKELQSLEIAVLYSKIPEEIKKEIVSPYISVEKDEARISIRIKDSLKDLRRNDLINKINLELNTKLGF